MRIDKEGFRSKESFYLYAMIALMLVYAVLGLFLYDDYGCGPDEGMERQTALVNYKYVVHKLHIPISQANETWLGYLPELHEYRDRYYGTALHFPLVLIEAAAHFTMEPSEFYGLRHLYTFLNYFLGVICIYRLLTRRFGSRKYGLAGALLMILSPRFFAESFYNNKDVIFVAWYAVCADLMDLWFRKQDLKTSVVLAFALALTCNTRFNGIIYLAVFVFLWFFERLRKHDFENAKLFLLTLGLTFLLFYLITPNFWESPFRTLMETLQFNMRHPNHGSEGNLFKGVLVDAAHTLTYIPVWIAITVPTVYLIFTLAGTLRYVAVVISDLLNGRFRKIGLTDAMMFISGFGAVIFIVLTHVTIYNGWRHCYFAYPCFVYFAVSFFNWIDKRNNRIVSAPCYALMTCALFYNGIWIALNHPFEYVYFVPWARASASEFSGDYWSVSSRALLDYIIRSDPERMLKINHAYSQAGSINRGLFPEEQKKYLELTYEQTPDVDYYIVCRDDIPSVDIGLAGYEKVFSVKVDQDEIGAVFKRSE